MTVTDIAHCYNPQKHQSYCQKKKKKKEAIDEYDFDYMGPQTPDQRGHPQKNPEFTRNSFSGCGLPPESMEELWNLKIFEGLMKTLIFPIAIYGYESWGKNAADRDKKLKP